MILVAAAELKTRISKNASAESEISPPPARIARVVQRRSHGRATKIMNNAYVSVWPTIVTVVNGLNLARTIALTRARMIQPVASSTAAAVIVRDPSRVRHVELNQHSAQNGKRRNGQSGSNKQGETELIDVLAHIGIDHPSESQAKTKRKNDAG